MIIGNTTIINPAQVVCAKRRGKMLFVTVTAVVTDAATQNADSLTLDFNDEDGDLFAALALEIERLSPPRPI